MKKSAIREMFLGKRGTYDHVILSQTYKEAENKMSAVVDAFLEKLTPEHQKIFYDAYEFIGDQSAAYAEDHFIEGFKFGLLMGMEIAETKE